MTESKLIPNVQRIQLEHVEDDTGFCKSIYRSPKGINYALVWDHGDDQPPTLFTATDEPWYEPDSMVSANHAQYYDFPEGHKTWDKLMNQEAG